MSNLELICFTECKSQSKFNGNKYLSFDRNEEITGWDDIKTPKNSSNNNHKKKLVLEIQNTYQKPRAKTPTIIKTPKIVKNRDKSIQIYKNLNFIHKPTKKMYQKSSTSITSKLKTYQKSFTSITPKLKTIMNIANRAKITQMKQKISQKASNLDELLQGTSITITKISPNDKLFSKNLSRIRRKSYIHKFDNYRCVKY
jgi:hypothetical protein